MKTYCVSDIHGHYDNYLDFKKTLNEDDKVFVLGDVVDKGEKPIDILLDIMNDKRFLMLLGNHEYMMYQYLTAENKLDKNEYGIQWLEYNSGYDTYLQYEKLEKDIQKTILDFISNLQVNIPELVVNNNKYYLIHGYPFTEKIIKTTDKQSLVEDCVWERPDILSKKKIVGDRKLICGHTPIQNYINECKPVFYGNDINKASIIDIDGGLAYRFGNEKLIALCLDDLSYKLY